MIGLSIAYWADTLKARQMHILEVTEKEHNMVWNMAAALGW